MLGRNRVTLHKWIRQYEIEGIEGLLQRKPVSGGPRTIPLWAEKALEKKLQEPQGFNGYQEIVEWLEQLLGIHTCYKTVHKLVHNKLKSSLKVPRPQSIAQQEEQQKAFKKNLADNLIMLNLFCIAVLCTTKAVRFWCEDETRIGLKTITGRKITARGVKPVGIEQWQFKATYLYGIIEPQTGASFFWEFSHLNTECFQTFLNLVAQNFVDSILIIQLDNGAFHKAKRLRVPDNIILLFQPPHSPQLNPIEQVWQYLKRRLCWLLPKNLEELRVALYAEINKQTN